MQFLMMTSGDPNSAPPPPTPELYAEMGKFIQEMSKAGVLLATGGLDPNAIRIKHEGGKFTVTDGPFTEAKEVIGGYAVYEVGSKEEAIEWTRRFMELHREHWPGWEGESEIRQIYEMPAGGPV